MVAQSQVTVYTAAVNSQRSVAWAFDNPAVYRIAVLGEIDASWSDWLEGMTVSLARQPEGMLVSTLEGELSDQAALVGVLNALYDRHRTVLSVQRLSR